MTFKELFPVFSYRAGKRLMILSTFFYRKNPKKWSIKKYKRKFGVSLNLDNPQTFYEKMNYWKHFCYNKTQDVLTDKLAVKELLKSKGYGYLCAECYCHSQNINEIKKWFYSNKDVIKQFVFKTNHGCGDVFIYDNGLITKKNGRKIRNIKQVFKMLKTSLKYNHYYSRFEQNYLNLKPEIFIEEYMQFDNETTEYELMSNYGEIRFAHVAKNRQSSVKKTIIADSQFNYLGIYCGEFAEGDDLKNYSPESLKFMKKFIKEFCTNYPFCRVDFVENNNKLYFCEFTFVKSGGLDCYNPKSLDLTLGKLFKI